MGLDERRLWEYSSVSRYAVCDEALGVVQQQFVR